MEQVNLYIKKLIVLVLSLFIFAFLSNEGNIFIGLPVGLFILSFLNFRITGEKPDYLFNLGKNDNFLNDKGGFWVLFKWIFLLLGFMYDLAVWTINGIYVFFLIVIDFLLLIKTILFWIIYAIIWFLKLFVPPVVFSYKMILHYLLKWPWWIYKLSFRNASISINKNFFIIGLWGGVFMLLLIGVFFGLGILVDIPNIVFIGFMFSVLPLVWSYTEISVLKIEGRAGDSHSSVRMKYRKGFDAVRAVLFYLLVFLIALILQVALNLLGWIPSIGLSLLGLTINLNTFISLILVFVFVILVFSKFLLPSHLVHNSNFENNLSSSSKFLAAIGNKFLRYLLAHIPGLFFAAVLSIIPFLIIFLAINLSLSVKDNVLDAKLSQLSLKEQRSTSPEIYYIREEIKNFQYYKAFPQNVFEDFFSLNELRENRKIFEQQVVGLASEIEKTESLFEEDIENLEEKYRILQMGNDSLAGNELFRTQLSLDNRKSDFEKWKNLTLEKQVMAKAKLERTQNLLWQLPLSFLFLVIWISLFGGLAMAITIAYLGSLYHDLYSFRENGKPSYFYLTALEIRKKDRNQPLLGFTLIVILVLVILILYGLEINPWNFL